MIKDSCIISDNIPYKEINNMIIDSEGNIQLLKKMFGNYLNRSISQSKITKWLKTTNYQEYMRILRQNIRDSINNMQYERLNKCPMPEGNEWIKIPTYNNKHYLYSLNTNQIWSPFRERFLKPILQVDSNKSYPMYRLNIAPRRVINVTVARLHLMCLDGYNNGMDAIKWQDGMGIVASQLDPFEPDDAHWSVNDYSCEYVQENAKKLLQIKYGKDNRPTDSTLPSISETSNF